MYTLIHTDIHRLTQQYTQTHTDSGTHINTLIHRLTQKYRHPHADSDTDSHTQSCTHSHIQTRTHSHTDLHSHTDSHTHSHMLPLTPPARGRLQTRTLSPLLRLRRAHPKASLGRSSHKARPVRREGGRWQERGSTVRRAAWSQAWVMKRTLNEGRCWRGSRRGPNAAAPHDGGRLF